jgi:peptidoglycan/xylan/chitin deacetylase (PgdA/CDA1 family)
MAEKLFALTNDDAGGEQPERFAELLDFLAAQQVPATFFVTPAAGGKPLDHKPEWISLLRRALAEGHELQLHSLTHADFEFGVPPDFMLDIMPEVKARWQREPERISSAHTLPALTGQLVLGKAILEQALGITPRGFRSGCLSICDNMYQALADQGFRWSSNLVVNPKGWHYINHQFESRAGWQPDIPPHPFVYQSGILEIPMLSEYTWFVREDDVERHYQLMRDDLRRTWERSGVFVTLSHYFAMTGAWSSGLRIYERIFAAARQWSDVRFCTLSQVIDG